MTEAAHQMASNPLPPGVRKPGSVGLAAGPEVAVLDDDSRAVAAGLVGEIAIRGANVTRGYENNPEANAQAFTGGWFRTGDQGYLDADGYLILTGRLKEIINRGGEKVSPREVDDALLEHPAVGQAVAFALAHPTLGEDVAAAVVLKPGVAAEAEDIRASLFGRLADFKIPSQVVVVPSIPKGPTGKIQRIGLAQRLADRLRTQHVPPRDADEATLARIFAEVLGAERVGVLDNFFALGGDSLRAFQILGRVRDRLAVDISIVELFKAPTVALLAQSLGRLREQARIALLEQALAEVESISDDEAARRLRQP
jgi:acyl carrier protein